MVEAEPETVLSILVARTKDAVRRLDSKNYRAAKKIFMLNNAVSSLDHLDWMWPRTVKSCMMQIAVASYRHIMNDLKSSRKF